MPSQGMPGSTKGLRWTRVNHGTIIEGVKSYRANRPDGTFLVAMLGHEPAGPNGEPLWHISVSHRNKDGSPGRCPTWEELKSAKYQLLPHDVDPHMVLEFPKKSDDYVDVHPTCLHLWECTEALRGVGVQP